MRFVAQYIQLNKCIESDEVITKIQEISWLENYCIQNF